MKVTYLITVKGLNYVQPEDVDDYLTDVLLLHGVMSVQATPVPRKMAKLFRKVLGF